MIKFNKFWNMNVIPTKIYLTKQELQDMTTYERMVFIGEPYRDRIVEYIDINQRRIVC